MTTESNQVKPEVVLDIEGKVLLSLGMEDLLTSPQQGSEFFYIGCLYEVSKLISTIGDNTSPRGSTLIDLLSVLYTGEKATHLFSTMKHIERSSRGSTDLTGVIGGGLLTLPKPERLLYIKLQRLSCDKTIAASNLRNGDQQTTGAKRSSAHS